LNSEFELIDLFNQIGSKYYKKNGVIIPPGDDCAVFESKKSIVTSVDASIEGIHFLKKTKPQDIAYRSIAIAMSDIAAMGCNPLAFSLSVTSPSKDRVWFEDFAKGTQEISNQFKIPLIGGDLTRGPLNINVIVYGSPYKKNILRRDGAMPGDYICISKEVGRGARGLKDLQDNIYDSPYIKDYLRPLPKVELGRKISDIANACIDTSDGLLVDMHKMLKASNCGGEIYLDDIPVISDINDVNAGDDYDLCFTIPSNKFCDDFIKIGVVSESIEIKLISNKGYDVDIKGYEHF
jgi:thiamine-monophosphate kinase